jgi:uncharacterized protein (DUF2249 family)
MPPLALIELCRVPAADQHRELLRAFDALRPGEGLSLTDEHEPRALLYQLQTERPGSFDWHVLELGKRARIEIRRRPATPRTITDFVATDHRRLIGLLASTGRAVAEDRFDEARSRLAEFRTGFERHGEMEEEVLLPLVTARLASASVGVSRTITRK